MDLGLHSKYVFPVSENQVGLMQTRHYLNREIWGNNFSSPVEAVLLDQNARVLDIGCGPGTWLLELATAYPQSQFIGIDCAAVFPQEIKPINSRFFAANILDGLPFPDDHFDFVYSRFMAFALTLQDWREIVIPELVRVTKPGGWIEFMEMDLKFVNSGPVAESLVDKVVDVLRSRKSIETVITPHLKEMLQSCASLEGIIQEERISPLGGATNIGHENLEVLKWGGKCLSPVMCFDLGIDHAEYKGLIKSAIREIESGDASNKSTRFWARKI